MTRKASPSRAYYNEHDPFAAAWLRELIKAGHIAPGDVDERSIEDVCPDDLAGYVQCHFFAGIGVWSHALRLAGWSDNRAIWTGSCPCQPFSAAGKGAGFDDERHLWPAFFDLIQQCNPPIVIGEQVASKDGLARLDLVSADVEGSGRAFAAADLCAAGFGAPHIRQRSFWVAYGQDERHERSGPAWGRGPRLADDCTVVRLADANEDGCGSGALARVRNAAHHTKSRGRVVGLGIAAGEGSQGIQDWRDDVHQSRGAPAERAGGEPAGWLAAGVGHNGAPSAHTVWSDADWLGCRDGKWRPVEPGTFPLAHGAANRVGRLRGYGNAIVGPVAQGFIEAVMAAEAAPNPCTNNIS
ncbi:DNA cytosine methyltransferase [Sphingomonas aerolata]|uniref:DNA cytosine methyltransferase n=1 Tax=Sphingomonas aerolata TaxID=185951 RepID=UPI00141BBD2B|nr:DNA cytosine methyltransferase [Sphingomonas aerolata]NII59798.1 DNA (cytosine-5)-methyltransferase 1 [Sphingomonas aerolata]